MVDLVVGRDPDQSSINVADHLVKQHGNLLNF